MGAWAGGCDGADVGAGAVGCGAKWRARVGGWCCMSAKARGCLVPFFQYSHRTPTERSCSIPHLLHGQSFAGAGSIKLKSESNNPSSSMATGLLIYSVTVYCPYDWFRYSHISYTGLQMFSHSLLPLRLISLFTYKLYRFANVSQTVLIQVLMFDRWQIVDVYNAIAFHLTESVIIGRMYLSLLAIQRCWMYVKNSNMTGYHGNNLHFTHTYSVAHI